MPLLRRLGAVLCALLLSAGCTSGSEPATAPARPPAPATTTSPPAPPSRPSLHVALGDSVAAGIGAAEPAARGYVPVLTRLLQERLECTAASPAPGCPLRLRNLAVSGATTDTLVRDQLPAALDLLSGATDVRLVTVTIGGNDVFGPVLRSCGDAPRGRTCERAVRATLQEADQGLARVLRPLAAAKEPETVLAVMTYYDPVPACELARLQPLAERVLEGSGRSPGLNDLVRARAAQVGAVVAETGDRLRAPDDFVGGSDCLHPSASGHARIAEAFADAVEPALAGR